MAEALKFLYELSSDHRRQAEQEALEKHERDQIAIKEFAFDEGFEKGVKTGIEQGIEQGIKQTALKMLKSGLELSTIVKITNLSEAQIKKLKLNKPLKK